MKTTENTWYCAKVIDESLYGALCDTCFKGNRSVFLTIEETKDAIDEHMKEWGKKEYYICQTTYRKIFDDDGRFVKMENICEAIETYPKEESNV